MESLLPRLSLVHFDVNEQIGALLAHINLDFLTSICIEGSDSYLIFILAVASSPGCQIDSLRLLSVSSSRDLANFLRTWPLKRLSLSYMGKLGLKNILLLMNLSHLEVLTICDKEYDWDLEKELASGIEMVNGEAEYLLQLRYKNDWPRGTVLDAEGREWKRGPRERLGRHRVRIVEESTLVHEYYNTPCLLLQDE